MQVMKKGPWINDPWPFPILIATFKDIHVVYFYRMNLP